MGTVSNGERWRQWTYRTAGNGHQEEGVWWAMGGGTGLNSLFDYLKNDQLTNRRN